MYFTGMQLHLQRPIDLRCVTQKPFKARSLPREMEYRKSKIMSANNEFLLLCGSRNLHLFDENLQLVRSTIKSPISDDDLVDMAWCEMNSRFIVLVKKKAYIFDPLTTQLSYIQSIQLPEDEAQFVSCTCSNDKLFIVTSASYHPYYMYHYHLPTFSFISRLTVTDLIGFDPLARNYWSTNWAAERQGNDNRKIISVRYHQQRLGVIIEIGSHTFLYALDLTEQPIKFHKIELPWRDGRLVVLAKSGEWLIVHDGLNGKLLQIALDCQFKAVYESKHSSQSSFFSLSTGFANLKSRIINAIILGSSQLVLLLNDSLVLYNI